MKGGRDELDINFYMGNYRRNNMGNYKSYSGLPVSSPFADSASREAEIRNASIQRELEQQTGINSLRQGKQPYHQTYRGLSIKYSRGYTQFSNGCDRAIREIRTKNKNNCITERLKGEQK